MGRWWRISVVVVLVLAVGVIGYTGYIGYEGSRQLVSRDGTSRDCRTPDVLFGWAYEAINYDIADDAELVTRNPDQADCAYEGTQAGTEVVSRDGVRIAGWYVPAASDIGPSGPTVVLVHGIKANKSGILRYGIGLHDEFNLVAIDLRNTGRSTGTETSGGVLEQDDLRAVIDWLARTKHPSRIGVLANSLGAVAALGEAGGDSRVEALALDSMHTRVQYQFEARVAHGGYFSYFGTTRAIVWGIQLRTGQNIESSDAEETIHAYASGRPLLLTHGTADDEDLPERTRAFYDEVVEMGIPAELHWCADAGHNAAAGMPVDVCRDAFGSWTHDFFTEWLG
jgi:dipeptidyl aminopeptidase/acylaminoacyl peptidase